MENIDISEIARQVGEHLADQFWLQIAQSQNQGEQSDRRVGNRDRNRRGTRNRGRDRSARNARGRGNGRGRSRGFNRFSPYGSNRSARRRQETNQAVERYANSTPNV